MDEKITISGDRKRGISVKLVGKNREKINK